MRIAYDHQIFGWQEYGGISRYFFELASHLAVSPGSDVTIAAPLYVNRYLKDCPPALNLLGRALPSLPKAGRILRAINSAIVPGIMRRIAPDIVHETYYATHRTASVSATVVLTVFDMIHERFARDYLAVDPTSREKAAAVARADHIICISENTRADLIELLDVPPAKTSVVYLGTTPMRPVRNAKQAGARRPYILHVGLRQGYKNFATLLKAYAHSPRLLRDFDLICFGGGRFTADELRLGAELHVSPQRLVQISGNDDELAAHYAGAAVLVYPSLYEGFGIPPLEAMSAGCPVVCGNTSSLPEVVGDAAETCRADDEEEMRAAIERVLDSRDRARDLVVRGLARTQRFTWKTCAEETLQIYQHLRSAGDGDLHR